MENLKIKGRFHVYTGFKNGSTVENELQAGEAYEVDCQSKPHYLVKMWSFPQNEFYLCRNKSDDDKFTLFAKKLETDAELHFRRPVGFGTISRQLKKHLEIQFTFPRQRVFMSLFPDDITHDSLLRPDGGVLLNEI